MRPARRILAILILAIITTVSVAWICAVSVPVNSLARQTAARARVAANSEGDGYLSIARWDAFGSVFVDTYAANVDDEPQKDAYGDGNPEALATGWLRRVALPWTTSDAPWPGPDDNDVRAIDGRGWPLICLWSEYRTDVNEQFQVIAVPHGAIVIPDRTIRKGAWMKPYAVTLPYRPVWIGLLANIAIYGAAWWVVLFVPGRIRGGMRRRRGCCVGCGYQLGGLERCPECGRVASPRTTTPQRAPATSRAG